MKYNYIKVSSGTQLKRLFTISYTTFTLYHFEGLNAECVNISIIMLSKEEEKQCQKSGCQESLNIHIISKKVWTHFNASLVETKGNLTGLVVKTKTTLHLENYL